MDCEKFESTLMDELYDELDELTSAASKRHVAGCARCASLLHGLSATRRIAVLERVEPPPGLEERILAATKEAQRVVPLRGRISGVVSWAGSWAMRPQTAMAAVFLLMIGSTSILLLRARAGLGLGSSTMVVTEQGAPAASAPADEENALDPAHAAGAHGAVEAHKSQAAPSGAAAPAAPASVNESFLAKDEVEARKGSASGIAAADEKEPARGPVALAPAPQADSFDKGDQSERSANAAAAAGAPMPSPAATMRQESLPPAMKAIARKEARAVDGAEEPRAEAKVGSAAAAGGGADDSFATAMAAYQAKNYDDATRAFDKLAAGGDVNASLMAARSVRDSKGCAAAVPRFDQIGARAYGTRPGYDATFEGGVCYRNMGGADAARNHFAQLLTVPSHAARAQAQLDAMSPRTRTSAPAKKSAPTDTKP